MANEEDDILIRAALRDELTKPLGDLERRVGQVQRTLDRASKSGTGLSTATRRGASAAREGASAWDRYWGSLARVDVSAESFGRRTRDFVTGAGAALLRWTKYAGAALVGIGATSAFRFAMSMEQARNSITNLLGSAGAANKLLDEMKAFAVRTPFNFDALVQSSQQLLAVGFGPDSVMSTMQALGDATAALGGGNDLLDRMVRNLGQIGAAQKVATRDMNDFASAGIPIWELMSRKLGVTTGQLRDMIQSAGGGAKVFEKLGGKEGIAALIGERFAGGMEAQSKTFRGVLSNFVDSFNVAMEPLASALLGRATRTLKGLTDRMMVSLPEFVKALSGGRDDEAGAALAKLFGLDDRFSKFFGGLLATFRAIGRVATAILKPIFGGIAQGIGAAFGGGNGRAATSFADTLNGIAVFLEREGPGIQTFVAALVEGAVTLVTRLQQVASAVIKTFDKVLELSKNPAIRGLLGAAAGGLVGGAPGAVAGGVIGAASTSGGTNGIKRQAIERGSRAAVYGGVGAGIGSLILPGGGTAVGAGVGALYGALFGDRATPVHHGTPRGFDRGHLAHSMRLYGAAAGMTPGRQVLTSTVRSWGLGSATSDHLSGRAFDVAGSNLQAFAQNVRRLGGHAEFHGSGAGRHVHAVGDRSTPMPRMPAMASSAAPVVVNIAFNAPMQRSDGRGVARDVRQAVAAAVREAQERT